MDVDLIVVCMHSDVILEYMYRYPLIDSHVTSRLRVRAQRVHLVSGRCLMCRDNSTT